MIALIQRVSEASVTVDGDRIGEINAGLLVLLGVEKEDNIEHAKKLANKVCNYRIFADSDGKMNLNVGDAKGEILVVSQFTLVADTSKGNRPGFSNGATPETGRALYHAFVDEVKGRVKHVATGRFGADMQVALINDGPVTFHLQV